MSGQKTCKHLAEPSYATPTAFSAMSTTMAMAALFSADPAMMLLGTSRVVSVGRSYVTLAGRDSTALNVSGLSIQPISYHSGGIEQYEDMP